MKFSAVVFLLLGVVLAPALPAQSSPRQTIITIFQSMYAADTTGMQNLFHPQATLSSVVTDKEGKETIQPGRVSDWLNGIAKHEGDPGELDEQTQFLEIRQDGRLATAWVPYTFVYGGKVSHCGTNAFQLVRMNGKWKVLNIVDTRNFGDCTTVDTTSATTRIEALATNWHRAAAEADSTAFFDALTDDAIYIGTDAGEHWTKAEFLSFAAPYFAAGKAWSFTAKERHVFYDENENIAYWDELLDTWMGDCRGTAVVKRDGQGNWKIAHYTLSVAVPNDLVQDYLKLLKKD